jgi:hypothetical protein
MEMKAEPPMLGDYDRVIHADEKVREREERCDDHDLIIRLDERFDAMEKQMKIDMNALQNLIANIKCPGPQCVECKKTIQEVAKDTDDNGKAIESIKTTLNIQWIAISGAYAVAGFVLYQLFLHIDNGTAIISKILLR